MNFRAKNRPAPVMLIGADHRVCRVDPRLSELLGYQPQELLGRTLADVTHPQDVMIDDHLTASLFAGNLQGYKSAKRYIHKDGTHVRVPLRSSVVRNPSGQLLCRMALIHEACAGETQVRLGPAVVAQFI